MGTLDILRQKVYGRTFSEQKKNVETEAWETPRGKGASAAGGKDGIAREQFAAKRLQEMGVDRIQKVETHDGGRLSFNPLGRDEQYDRIAPGYKYDENRRRFLKYALMGTGAVAGGAALANSRGIAEWFSNLFTRNAKAAPGAGQSGTTLSPTDIDAKRIGGVRYATEFDTANHTGTTADPFTDAAIRNAMADISTIGGWISLAAVKFGMSNPAIWNYPISSPSGYMPGMGLVGMGDAQIEEEYGTSYDPGILGGTQLFPTASFPSGVYMLQFNPTPNTPGPNGLVLKWLRVSGIAMNCLQGNTVPTSTYTRGLASGLYVDSPEDCVISDVSAYHANLNGIDSEFSNVRGGTASLEHCFSWYCYGTGQKLLTGQGFMDSCTDFHSGTNSGDAGIWLGSSATTQDIVEGIGCYVAGPPGNAFKLGEAQLLGCIVNVPSLTAHMINCYQGYCLIVGLKAQNVATTVGSGAALIYAFNFAHALGAQITLSGNIDTLVNNTYMVGGQIIFAGHTINTYAAGYALIDNVIGVNRKGWGATTPGVGLSGVDVTNPQPYRVLVYITGIGTGITAVGVTDTGGTLTSFTRTAEVGDFYQVDPGGKIRLTYTGSPTWAWYGL